MTTTEQVTDKALGVADKALDGVDSLMTAAGDISERFAELAATHGQTVVDVGLNVVRINAGASALTSLVFGAIALASLGYGVYFTRKGFDRDTSNTSYCEDSKSFNKTHLPGNILLMVSVAVGFPTVLTFNIWNFIGVIYPELWIANKMLGL